MKRIFTIVIGCTLAAGVAACSSSGSNLRASALQPAEAAANVPPAQRQSLFRVPGIALGKVIASGSSANMIGIRTEALSIGRRTDSRTLFIYNRGFSDTQKGMYGGSDGSLIAAAQRLMRYLGIPLSEVAGARVLQEKLRSGHYDRPTRTVGALSPVLNGHRYAVFRREIGRIPVFTSRAWVALMPDGSYGDVKIHWPVISRQALLVAGQYQAFIRAGRFNPPPHAGSRVISVTAGIVHSPANALVMDVRPAIRVVYSSNNRSLAKLPVAYVDANGRSIVMPRVFPKPPATWAGRSRSRSR